MKNSSGISQDSIFGALALAWVMGQPEVTSLIVGSSRFSKHLRLAREALSLGLAEEELVEIGRRFDVRPGLRP